MRRIIKGRFKRPGEGVLFSMHFNPSIHPLIDNHRQTSLTMVKVRYFGFGCKMRSLFRFFLLFLRNHSHYWKKTKRW